MAQKKIPSIADALKTFKDTMLRASLTNYYYVNRVLLSKNPKNQSLLIVPDQELWDKIIEDKEMQVAMKELDIKNPEEYKLNPLFRFADNIDGIEWHDIDVESLFKGKVVHVTINSDFDYKIPINKDILPLKLRKSEYNNVSYKIMKKDINGVSSLELGVKKKFDSPVPGGGFTMIRVLKIL